MIIDVIQNAEFYYGLSDKMEIALKFLKENKFEEMAAGRYEILGDKVYALVQEYTPKEIEEYEYEAHRKYIDIQFVVSGKERMAYSYIDNLSISKEYDEIKERLRLKGNGDLITVKENSFVIFMPSDAHAPCLKLDDCSHVKKVVVKVSID